MGKRILEAGRNPGITNADIQCSISRTDSGDGIESIVRGLDSLSSSLRHSLGTRQVSTSCCPCGSQAHKLTFHQCYARWGQCGHLETRDSLRHSDAELSSSVPPSDPSDTYSMHRCASLFPHLPGPQVLEQHTGGGRGVCQADTDGVNGRTMSWA